MIPSREYLALRALLAPEQASSPPSTRTGDLWHIVYDKRLHYIMLVLGHKKRGRGSEGHTYVYFYHWGQPSLRAKPCDLRDFDANATSAESTLRSCLLRKDSVRYLGNLFDILPFTQFVRDAVTNEGHYS